MIEFKISGPKILIKIIRRVFMWYRIKLIDYTPIIIFSILALLGFVIIFILDRNDSSFNKHDILVEAHGLVFDLVVFGLIITIFDFFRTRKEKRIRLNEEIEDLIDWKCEESKFKILAKIKRLYEIGQRKFYLSNAYLKGADFGDYDLSNSMMVLANLKNSSFVRANLTNVSLTGSNLKNVYFTKTYLENTNLLQSKCQGAIFTDAQFINTNLEKADLRNTQFTYCYFKNINIKNAVLENAIVDDLKWFDNLIKNGASGVKELTELYFVDKKTKEKIQGVITFRIKKK